MTTKTETRPLNVAREVAALQRMTIKQLREKYAEVFGETTATGNRTWLVRRVTWGLQALSEGDLSERAKARASELARDADLRLSSPTNPTDSAEATEGQTRTKQAHLACDARLPLPGTILTRKYKGGVVQVKVLAEGFEYDGQVYGSLSAVAKAVWGNHYKGFLLVRPDRREVQHEEGEQQHPAGLLDAVAAPSDQLPSHLPRQVLGLWNSFVIHKLIDPVVVSPLKRTVGGVDHGFRDRLSGLVPGQAIMSFPHSIHQLFVAIEMTTDALNLVIIIS